MSKDLWASKNNFTIYFTIFFTNLLYQLFTLPITLPFRNESPAMFPSLATVPAGTYPLQRPICTLIFGSPLLLCPKFLQVSLLFCLGLRV